MNLSSIWTGFRQGCAKAAAIAKTQLAVLAAVGMVAVGAVTASPAMAGGTPTMPPIELPVDAASVASAIAIAGGTILLLVFGVSVGFSLAKKLMARIRSAV